MIPKYIFQTWKTKELPESIQIIRQRIQKLNDEYNMLLFDDNDIDTFIKSHFSDHVYDCYSKLNVGAAKADFWRYCILYIVGGVYLDIDAEIKLPLDDLIQPDDKCIITREKNPGCFNNWIMIFEANHPILLETIHNCCYNIEHQTSTNIAYLTGPAGPFTKAINDILVPKYNQTVHLWYESDENLNNMLKTLSDGVRFYGFDLEEYASWKHAYADDLYKQQGHWTMEKNIFR